MPICGDRAAGTNLLSLGESRRREESVRASPRAGPSLLKRRQLAPAPRGELTICIITFPRHILLSVHRKFAAGRRRTAGPDALCVFQHSLNFGVRDRSFKLHQLVMLTGMINVAKSRARQRAQDIVFRKLPQGVALADGEMPPSSSSPCRIPPGSPPSPDTGWRRPPATRSGEQEAAV